VGSGELSSPESSADESLVSDGPLVPVPPDPFAPAVSELSGACTVAPETLGAGITFPVEGDALLGDSDAAVSLEPCSVGAVDELCPDCRAGFSVPETKGTNTSIALPIVPPSIPFRVSALMAIAAVAVPSTPTMVKAVIHEDFILLGYKTPGTEEPPENPRLVQDFRGASPPVEANELFAVT